MLGLAIYEAGVCRCGWHTRLTTDPQVDFGLEYGEPCQVCAAFARNARSEQHADDQIRKKIGDNPLAPHPGDGRRVLAQLKPPRVGQSRVST